MKKNLGILLLIFCLFLFGSTGESKGQIPLFPDPQPLDVGTAFFSALLISLMVTPPQLSDCNKCDSCWHPGDYYYEKNFYKIRKINIDVLKCGEVCQMKLDKNVAMGSVREYDGKVEPSYYDCYKPCVFKALEPFPSSVATCKYEGTEGYYSDGSYYDSPSRESIDRRLYENTHKLKDKYEKSEWQKARDECMEFTSKKKKFFETASMKQKRMYSTYNNCLKERGF